MSTMSRTCRVAILALLSALVMLGIAPTPPARAATVTYSATQTIPVPPASTYAGGGGGDGWAVGLTSTDVYNVFHHSAQLTVACHHQSDGSSCWSPVTVTDPGGSNFATGSQPGVWVDQSTSRLYVYATRVLDQIGGVVCFDPGQATQSLDPFCGFIQLTGSSQSALDPGFSMISNPVMVNGKWYAFNFANNSTATGAKNAVLCFDTARLAACTNQPFLPSFGAVTLSGQTYPSPSIAAIGGRLVIPGPTALGDVVACIDSATGTNCSGQWPVATSQWNTSNVGAPFPLLSSAGAVAGFCVPSGADSCWNMVGTPVATPANLSSAVTSSSGWNGPAVVIGPRVYMPNGNTNQVQCFDYATGATCAGFPKSFANLSLLYTVNPDPFRPTCLWVNSDNGSGQIQNFDAYTGGACGQGAIRVLASSFVVDTQVCQPASYTSLQVTTPAPGSYTAGSISFQDADANPITGAPDRPLDGTGTADLSGLQLSTALGLPQFLITLSGASSRPSDVVVKLTWSGTDDPSCAKPGTVVGGTTASGCTDVSVIAAMGSGQYFKREGDLSPSPQLSAMYKAVQQRATKHRQTTGIHVLNYPAPSVDSLFAGVNGNSKLGAVEKLSSNADRYLAGEKQGVKALDGVVRKLETNCPWTKIILTGYSQGAMVLHDWVNEQGNATHPAIVGIGFLADPERVANTQVLTFGDASLNSYGVCAAINAIRNCASPAKLADIAPSYIKRSVGVCVLEDIVCDTSTVLGNVVVNTNQGRAQLIKFAQWEHGTYSWLPATKTAGMWLANRAW